MRKAKRQLAIAPEDAPRAAQHSKPCTDCPWRRRAIAGWLGSMTASEWVEAAHGEAQIDCHTTTGPQCAGAAIYRANVAKIPRDRDSLRLPADRDQVFAWPAEFLDHHVGKVDQAVTEIGARKRKSS